MLPSSLETKRQKLVSEKSHWRSDSWKRFQKRVLVLEEIIEYPTDYHYLIVKPNYIFYRIEGNIVRIIRILNEKQDFLQILFGISSISQEGEDYWEE